MIRKRVRASLVRPPVDVLHKFSKPVESLAIGYLATSLRRAGHTAIMLDAMLEDWSDEETVKRILNESPDLIGFTTVLQRFPENLPAILKRIRSEGFDGPILVGGHAVSFFADAILGECPELDGVIQGEGEETIVTIANAMSRDDDWRHAPGVAARHEGRIVLGPVRRIRNLDALGEPARDLTPDVMRHDGLVAVSTSRGCHARCTFCSVPRFYGLERGRTLARGDWLARDALASALEIATLSDRFGVREILIVDDEFFGGSIEGQDRAIRFANELAALRRPVRFALSFRAENAAPVVLEKLAAAGLAHVFIGLESGHDPDLKLYGKGHSAKQNEQAVRTVKSLGLSFQPGFMLFNHHSTLSSLREGLYFLDRIDELKPVTINTAVDPHFGAPLTKEMRRHGALKEGPLEMSSTYSDPAVEALKVVADLCSRHFVPFMNFIATTQSAITYEWRRNPPGRTLQTRRVLDAFERGANSAFAAVVIKALEALERQPDEGAEIVHDAEVSLRAVVDEFQVKKALVAAYLESAEGGVRYTSQVDLIATSAVSGAFV